MSSSPSGDDPQAEVQDPRKLLSWYTSRHGYFKPGSGRPARSVVGLRGVYSLLSDESFVSQLIA